MFSADYCYLMFNIICLQEVENEFNEKKSHYESISAGLESNRAQLEQAVSALREEVFNQDSRFYYLQCMSKVREIKKHDLCKLEMGNLKTVFSKISVF